MKPNNYLLLSLFLCTLLASCSKEGAGEKEKEKEPDTPVSLIPHVAGISLTKAGIEDAKDVEAIGFYAVGTDKTDKTYGTWPAGKYGKYTEPEGSNNFSPATAEHTIWLQPGKTATIFSFYPALDKGSDIKDASTLDADGTTKASTEGEPEAPVPTIPVSTAAISLSPTFPAEAESSAKTIDYAASQYDYMYGVAYNNATFSTAQPTADGTRTGGTPNTSGPAISIGLKHAFAQIRFVLKKDVTYPSSAWVKQITYSRATINSLTAKTRMKLTDGALLGMNVPANGAAAYTFALTSDAVSNGLEIKSEEENENLTITSYALPCGANASTITVKVGDKDMSISYSDDPAWEAGKIYTYSLTIKGTGLSFSGVSVVGWHDAPENNTSGKL